MTAETDPLYDAAFSGGVHRCRRGEACLPLRYSTPALQEAELDGWLTEWNRQQEVLGRRCDECAAIDHSRRRWPAPNLCPECAHQVGAHLDLEWA